MSDKLQMEEGTLMRAGRRSFLTSGLALAPLAFFGALNNSEAAVTVTHGRQQKGLFREIQAHENDHVAFLVMALGADARPKPTFRNLVQRRFTEFVLVSQALENTGVGAYLGAAPVLNSRDYLAAAGSIMTVEARHAGTINYLLKGPVTTNNESFDKPLTPEQVVAAAGSFIADLNGGPEVGYSPTPSDANDIAILNFALALEYLEAEFYNVNDRFY